MKDIKRERRTGGFTTVSASVAVPVAERPEAFVRRTNWPQSRVISSPLELYTELSPVALQRMTELGVRLGDERVRDAVAQAVDQVIDHLEWEVVPDDTARELDGRLPAAMSEEELVRQAQNAIAASRAARPTTRAVERVSERRPRGRNPPCLQRPHCLKKYSTCCSARPSPSPIARRGVTWGFSSEARASCGSPGG